MSKSVMSIGIIAPLLRKLTRDELSDWGGKLWEAESMVTFNHEGTLAITDMPGPKYGLHLGPIHSLSFDPFDDLKQFGLDVAYGFAYTYREVWHNNGDPLHYNITLDEFLEETAQRDRWIKMFAEKEHWEYLSTEMMQILKQAQQ